ncbi:MAG: D-aminoacyl-tRNA deacylase [Flavobacteriales bacterium]
MRAVLQRVNFAELRIDNQLYSSIKKGLVVLIGIEDNDGNEDIEWLVKKISNMRIFSDSEGKMNLSLLDLKGELLIVSQFTLFAKTKKGNRPSFIDSAKPDIAIPIYNKTIQDFKSFIGEEKVQTGQFGANMQILLENDGPVTIQLDTKRKE